MRLLILLLGLVAAPGCASLRHACCEPPPIICPQCNQHCVCELEKVTEEKTCYEVECEAICIPRVKFWWEDCCEPPRCAQARLVHKLVKKEYECEHCRYKWTPVCCEPCEAPCASCHPDGIPIEGVLPADAAPVPPGFQPADGQPLPPMPDARWQLARPPLAPGHHFE